MLIRTSLVAALLALTAQAPARLLGDEVRYFDKDGITYQETRQTVRHSVPETHIEQRESVTYRPQYTSELKETQRVYMSPVTEYQWVPYMQRSWNPFAAPVLTYRLVPQTHLEPRTETVRIPETRCQMVQEKHIVQVPVTTPRIAEGQIVTSVPIGVSAKMNSPTAPASTPAASPLVRSDSVGGLHKFESDPPRQSSNPGAADGAVQR